MESESLGPTAHVCNCAESDLMSTKDMTDTGHTPHNMSTLMEHGNALANMTCCDHGTVISVDVKPDTVDVKEEVGKLTIDYLIHDQTHAEGTGGAAIVTMPDKFPPDVSEVETAVGNEGVQNPKMSVTIQACTLTHPKGSNHDRMKSIDTLYTTGETDKL